jgi:hypothetical protein
VSRGKGKAQLRKGALEQKQKIEEMIITEHAVRANKLQHFKFARARNSHKAAR